MASDSPLSDDIDQDLATEAEEHSPLSPFVVLRNKQSPAETGEPVAPVSPAPVPIPAPAPLVPAGSVPAVAPIVGQVPPPVEPPPITPVAPPVSPPPAQQPVPTEDPALSREELLKEAAEAPEVSLLLPSEDEQLVLKERPSFPTPAPIAPVVPAVSLTPQPVVKPAVPKGNLLQQQKPSVKPLPPLPPRPANGVPPAPPAPTPPIASPPLALASSPVQIPLANVKGNKSGQKSKVGVISLIGAFLALLILASSGYFLSLRGVRVPLFFAFVSGVKATGLTEASTSLAAVQGHGTYQYLKDSTISLQLQSQSGSKALPAGDASASSAIASLKTSLIGQGQAKNDAIAEKATLSAGGTVEVPVFIKTSASGSTNQWVVQLPLNAQTGLNAISPSEIKNTLLYSSLQPIPLTELLAAVKSETAYAPLTASGQNIASYTYTLQDSKLQPFLPTDATWDSGSLEMQYAWKSNLPTQAKLQGVLKYQGNSYAYQATYLYGGWDQALGSDETDLTQFQQLTTTNTAPSSLLTSDFIAQLGVTLANLPNSLSSSSNSSPTGTSSGSSTTTLPTPITPKGQSATSAGSAITSTLPPPATESTADAISRDSQRKQDLTDLQTALENYKKATGKYPVSNGLEQVQASVTLFQALVPSYLSAMPIDPTPTTYWYEYQSDGSTFTVRSVAENPVDASAKLGKSYHYFEYTNK